MRASIKVVPNKEVRGENDGMPIQAHLGEIPDTAGSITDIDLVDVIISRGIVSQGNREEEPLYRGGTRPLGKRGHDPPVVIEVIDHPGVVKNLAGISEEGAQRLARNPGVGCGFRVNIEMRVSDLHKMVEADGAMGVRRVCSYRPQPS